MYVCFTCNSVITVAQLVECWALNCMLALSNLTRGGIVSLSKTLQLHCLELAGTCLWNWTGSTQENVPI